MTNDPRCKYRMYLINENAGTWDDNGIWWSNQSHKRYAPSTSTYYSKPKIWQEPAPVTTLFPKSEEMDYVEEEETLSIFLDNCLICDEPCDLDANPYYCPSCEGCFDCNMKLDECMCYIPRELKSKHELEPFYREW
jgi:hypothetical protein